ncbi:MAG: methylmalonyl-CoA mutase [Actinobacteria bacterium]|nr:methylmalonyl-CoA mutase [Actinomycetota bacterium]
MGMRPLKILIGKPGLDGHDRGAKVIARALTESGIDVFYTGLHQSAADIADHADREAVDAIGLSILSGAHMTTVPMLLDLLSERDLGSLPVFVGGIIPRDDVASLTKLGVAHIFTPGTPVGAVVEWVSDNIRVRS